jgi:hypothetical protein
MRYHSVFVNLLVRAETDRRKPIGVTLVPVCKEGRKIYHLPELRKRYKNSSKKDN